MTMLDQMRRHMGWLKWSLGLVCLAFIVFYIPDFLQGNGTDAASGDSVARVNGRDISAADFRRSYQAQLEAYRNAYGANVSEQLLKQLGLEQQILQQMVDQQAALAEASRVGITVSDEEVRQRILTTPAFQENGAFIGQQRYEQLLAAQRPPITPGDFEESVREELTVEKLRSALTDWMTVNDKDLEQAYRHQNDKVKLDVINVTTDSVRSKATATDAEVMAYYTAHTADFRVPEKRKVRYLLVDVDALRAKVNVPAADVERAYNDNIQQYTTPEQVRASHILLKTDGKDDAAVKAKAEEILKQARAGADFAALARKYSQDEASAKNGGDLDYFSRGKMVPEFDKVAFEMQPGQISDLVKTQYGYHIIKVTDKKAASTRSLAEVRQQITDQLAYQTAQGQAQDLAQALAKEITKPADLDTAARAHGLTVQESGFFSQNDTILGMGNSPDAVSRAFDLKPGEVSGPLRTARGFAFETFVAKQDSYIPKFDEVKDKVKDAVLTQKAHDLAMQQATDAAAKLKGAADFDKAAKAAGLAPKMTDLITRDSPLPDVGAAPEIIDAAFALPVGSVSSAMPTAAGAVVFKVVDKKEVTAADWAIAKDKFRDDTLTDRRNRFFSAYMVKAKQRMTISVNNDAVQRAIG